MIADTYHWVRLLVAASLGYVVSLIIIFVAMTSGYRFQTDIRLDERTREIHVAYETVTSTAAATSELFYALIADDPELTAIVAAGNEAAEAELGVLSSRLYSRLRGHYEILQQQDFRQVQFHLRDNRSLVRFHRPERFGDDLTSVRATVRATNATGTPSYGFEEGRVHTGFRYVYPLFHNGEHVGSVEASMNYQAIISRMRASRPVVYDFVLSRQVVESTVFEDLWDDYQTTCFNDLFVRETAFGYPDTTAIFGVDIACINESLSDAAQLSETLESFSPATIPFSVDGVPVAVSLVPIRNFEGTPVAFIFGYTRADELVLLKNFFMVLTLVLALLSTTIFGLYLRGNSQHKRVIGVSRRLIETMQAKDRFFSIVSHDLRGPMGALASLSEMLREELQNSPGIDEARQELVGVIADGAKNSFQLLEDLLDWSRSQRGDIHFRPTRLVLDALVREQFSILHQAAVDKDITLSNRVGETVVHGDEYMVKTVVRNLVSNAIKFTPAGGSVTVTAEELPDGAGISVTDTGVGMTEQQQIDVFDLTVKSSTQGTGSEGGTGLGLMVCGEFVARHGGSISIESTVGVGSTFRVFLPKGSDPLPTKAPAATSPATARR